MKDLYKRLGIEPGASTSQIRQAISFPVPTVDAAALQAAEYVLLDPKRRAVYDRAHKVLKTIGGLRSHMGLNFKTFWARGKLRDFTYDIAAPKGRGPRRSIRSIRPADIRRAFGLQESVPASDYEDSKRRIGVIALLLLAITIAAVAALIYYTIAR